MTILLSLAGIMLCLLLARQLWHLHVAGLRQHEAEHARTHQIRQDMDTYPAERWARPALQEGQVDPVLALRIRQGISRGLWTRRVAR
jgi:hypothetical protein